MKPLTLIIGQNNTTHKLELAKAVTFSNNDAKQDKKITYLEAEIADLKASQATIRDKIVEVRYFQSIDKPTALPPGPAAALFKTKMKVGYFLRESDNYLWNNSGYLKDYQINTMGGLPNENFKIGNDDYNIKALHFLKKVARDDKTDISNFFNFAFGSPSLQTIDKSNFDDICIRIGTNAFVLSEADQVSKRVIISASSSYTAKIIFQFNLTDEIFTADDIGKEIDVAIEPLDWTTTLPPHQRKIGGKSTRLYMAIKAGGAWQVVRVNHPDQ